VRDISWRVWELIGGRKDRWGRKSQLEMAKRKEMRALEKELERRGGGEGGEEAGEA